MNGKNGKQSDYPEIALVPYPVIVAASWQISVICQRAMPSVSRHCGGEQRRPGRYENSLAAFQRLHSEPVHAEALRRARQRLLWR